MIRILIADDHAIVREGLKQIVSQETDMRIDGEAESADEMFRILEKSPCDIIVLDISMPGKSGLEALKELKQKYADLPVLILSIYSEDQYGIRALRAGAAGFLKKVSAPGELVTAIRKIIHGGRYISESLAEKMADNLSFGNRLPHETLSDREYQIMCQIATGMSAEQIADDLKISVHTVYSYRNRLLDKMKMKSNVELTRYAVQNKLIDS
jgi:DNA-binding NarL/FixJ family response regulator